MASPRTSPATFEFAGMAASRSGRPMKPPAGAPRGRSNSTIWTLPSANTSVWRAAGSPSSAAIALAVSISGEIMKSTSNWRSRQASRYASLVVRMIVRASVRRLTSIAAIRFDSSLGLQPTNRSQPPSIARRTTRFVVPSPSIVPTSKWSASAASRAPSTSTTVIS
jgi:hypothetical protein